MEFRAGCDSQLELAAAVAWMAAPVYILRVLCFDTHCGQIDSELETIDSVRQLLNVGNSEGISARFLKDATCSYNNRRFEVLKGS